MSFSNSIAEADTLKKKFVKFGACYKDDRPNGGDGSGGKFQKCAFDWVDCNDGIFVPSVDMPFGDSLKCSHDLVLPNAGGVTISGGVTMGRCTNPSDDVGCTNRADSCEYPADFKTVDDSCTLQNDLITKTITRFPFCNKKKESLITCVWSEEDCERSDLGTFQAATSLKKYDVENYDHLMDGCDCSLVHTGGCIRNDDELSLYCATSPEACGEETSFVDVRELLHEYRIDCRLCHGSGNSIFTDGARDAMMSEPTPVMTLSPIIDNVLEVQQQRQQSNDTSATMSTGAIAGIIMGAVAVLFVIIGGVSFFYLQKEAKRNTKPREASSAGIPLACNGDTMKGIEKIGTEDSNEDSNNEESDEASLLQTKAGIALSCDSNTMKGNIQISTSESSENSNNEESDEAYLLLGKITTPREAFSAGIPLSCDGDTMKGIENIGIEDSNEGSNNEELKKDFI